MELSNIQKIIFLIVLILIAAILFKKSNEYYTCNKESRNDNIKNMCIESCDYIYNNCPTTCNSVCECDATDGCLKKCRRNCENERNVCVNYCKNNVTQVI